MAEHAHRRLFKDIAGVLLLALVALGLGVVSRSGRWAQAVTVARNELAHPVFSLGEFRSYVDSRRGLILDARNASDYARGHVPGALSLPVDDFDRHYEKLKGVLAPERGRVLIVYCADMWCGLGDDLQQKLINYGFEHVGTFPDGWKVWSEANLPAERTP